MTEQYITDLTGESMQSSEQLFKAVKALGIDPPALDLDPVELKKIFDARNEITAYRMNNVRELKGWPPAQFNLKTMLIDGMIAFAGEDANALPPGGYWLWLEITDLDVAGGTINVDIDENEPGALGR